MSLKAAATPSSGEIAAELIKASASPDWDFLINQHPDLVTPVVVEHLGEMVRQRVRVDVDEALKLAGAAVAIAEQLKDGASLGRSYRARANALWFKGDCKSAAELFDRAASHFEAAGMPAEVGRTLSSSIQTLALLGEYERAFAAAAKAREIFEKLGDPWRRARLELNVANIHHRQDRFAEALTVYERAYAELLAYKDAEGVGVAMHNMAVCLIMLNDFDRALACYERARELCRQNGMPVLELQADYNVAYLYYLRGDYDTAIRSLHRVRQQSALSGDEYHQALCDLDEAEIYLELNLTDEASRMAEDARRRFARAGLGFETGRALASLAVATHRQTHSDRALELLAEAKAVFEREGNRAWLALVTLYSAIVLYERGKHEQARKLCETAREIFQTLGLDRREIICDLLLVRLLLDTGKGEDARTRCQGVLQKLNIVDAPLLSFQAHLLLGNAQRMSGKWSAAYESYNLARLELEKLRSTVQGEELRISFLRDKVSVYENLVDVCLRTQTDGPAYAPKAEIEPDTVFGYMEQAKSRTLAETVFSRSSRVNWAGSESSRAERVRQLKGELNWLYHRIESEETSPDEISVERIHMLRAEARRKEDLLVRIVRETDGIRSHSTVLSGAVSVGPRDIRAALHPDAAIVEYFQTETEFVAAVVTTGGTRIFQLAPVAQVSSHIRMLEFQLSKFRLTNSYPENFHDALLAATLNRLQELHRDLFRPLAPVLKERHLVVVPHGILHHVPFHALFDGARYLIDRFTMSVAPSATIYTVCTQRPANTHGRALVMGVQDENAPFIENEVRAVALALPESQVFLGAGATTQVLRTAGPESRLIHIATHGRFRSDNAMFSSVRMADSHMSLYDLYDLRLPVDLLTLSGCGTGLNGVAAGDELLGLTRGLLCAGARTLLLSLWDVHDRTTAEFMSSFYAHPGTERDKAMALRAAMLDTRARHPHPYFWAPFMLVGKVMD